MVSGQVRRRQGAGDARRAGRGFTLVEVLIVIGIMAILFAIALPSGIAMRRQSRRATCASNLKAIGQALLIFREDYQCFPPDRDEYLWTKEAADAYYQQYGVMPPNYDPSVPSLIAAAYYPDGTPVITAAVDENPKRKLTYRLHGLGLYTLYYLGSYAAALPPETSDPRFTEAASLPQAKISKNEGFNQPGVDWFKGAGYIREREVFHCPENTDVDLDRDALVQRWRMPLLTTPVEVSVYNEQDKKWETVTQQLPWNNYDLFYHRNQWNPGFKPEAAPDPAQGERHLLQPYPPSDTVVTWCPYHRKDTRRRSRGGGPGHVGPHQTGQPSPGANQQQGPATTEGRDFMRTSPGDMDLVLFADGSVRRLTSRADNKTYEAPPGDTGWPQGPVM